jgi:glucuronate isomerase
MFTLDYLLRSDWYRERLIVKQKSDVMLWQRHLRYVDQCLGNQAHMWAENSAELLRRRGIVVAELERASSSAYLEALNGTLGLDPSLLASIPGRIA